MDYHKKILIDFELHADEGIKECFDHGVNPNTLHEGKPLIYALINMYTRGASFRKCIQAFVDYKVEFEDSVLLAVLLNDAVWLDKQLKAGKQALTKHYTLDCTFTPLYEASLLHVCAEYNHLACAEVLVRHGADINALAGVDSHGFGGHTPIFHTVNQHANASLDVLKFFLSQNADLTITAKGLIWGKGYDWETFVPAVNPISYAMMGLLRQFQRSEKQIYEVVSLLLKAAYGIEYNPPNIPNKYLVS